MLFGNALRFGIEIGKTGLWPDGRLYCQFRFWVCGKPIGDWDDRISVYSSASYMRDFCGFAKERAAQRFPDMDATETFDRVYDAFFRADYLVQKPESPNLRDRFHLDWVGMGAIMDKYGIVLVATTETEARLIVKDLRRDVIDCDCMLRNGEVEDIGQAYWAWATDALKLNHDTPRM